jgi:HK97 family phage prohead protease
MPYYITDKNSECSNWAVEKEDGELVACHDTKESAIDQAVAISIAEDTEFVGERAAIGSLAIDDYVSWSPLDPKVAAQIVMVEGQFAVVRLLDYEDGIFTPTDKMMVINVFQLEKIPTPKMIAFEVEEVEEIDEPQEENNLPDNYRPALAEDVPEGRACGNCFFFDESRKNAEGDKAWCERWDDFVDGGYYCDSWQSNDSTNIAEDAKARMTALANKLVARINNEESMTKENKWLDVARAIQLKIDGPQPEAKEPEVRTNSVDFEVRSEGDGMTFTGYASVFNSPSEDLGGFVEYVAPGAFKRSLQSRNEVKLLWNHDSGEPLASLRGGTMQLVEDSVGLKVTAKLPNTTRGRDIAELLRTKVIDSMSFGFNVIKDSWSRDGQTRTLESVRLFETSIVSFPAYSATTATVRSAPSINADDLADALLKLENGEELDENNANLITEVVAKLKAQPEVQEVEDNGLSILDLKQKQFDLLMKRI